MRAGDHRAKQKCLELLHGAEIYFHAKTMIFYNTSILLLQILSVWALYSPVHKQLHTPISTERTFLIQWLILVSHSTFAISKEDDARIPAAADCYTARDILGGLVMNF